MKHETTTKEGMQISDDLINALFISIDELQESYWGCEDKNIRNYIGFEFGKVCTLAELLHKLFHNKKEIIMEGSKD